MSFLANPDKTARAQEASGIGRFSFGYFSLSVQRKVSRPWVREPTLKTVALATHYFVVFILRQAQDEWY